MAEHSIEMVRQAEKQAEETTRAAAQQAAQIVDSARDEAAALALKAEEAARSKAAGELAAAHTASQKFLEDAMEGLNSEMEALAAKARANQDGAVKQILAALA